MVSPLCEQDSPINKLLYARDIPRYKQMVERWVRISAGLARLFHTEKQCKKQCTKVFTFVSACLSQQQSSLVLHVQLWYHEQFKHSECSCVTTGTQHEVQRGVMQVKEAIVRLKILELHQRHG